MNRLLHILLAAALISGCVSGDRLVDGWQESEPLSYIYDQGQVLVSVDNSLPPLEVDSLLATIGINRAEVDVLQLSQDSLKTSNGWELIAYDEDRIVFRKPLSQFGTDGDDLTKVWMGDRIKTVDYSALDVPYGSNAFKNGPDIGARTPIRFTLKGHDEAKHVYLSGTFNNWSTLSNPMEFQNGAWTTEFPLEVGKHLYKFIVDGHWQLDPRNTRNEDDGMGNTNSVLYIYNHEFTVDAFSNAQEVYLMGSFNDWRTKELRMERDSSGWHLPMYLRTGTHAYKYNVDGKIVLDPNNPIVRNDGAGNENSFMSIGDTLIFELKGYPDAKEVFLAGDFNAWQTGELRMTQTPYGWEIPYVLRSGNHTYKYIVDGQWVIDPDNPVHIGEGKTMNSVRIVNPNTSFSLADRLEAKTVYLSGSFNDWSTHGYAMVQGPESWDLSIYLPPGKHRYQFLINGEDWMKDPANPLWEWSEYRTKNSFIWKE